MKTLTMIFALVCGAVLQAVLPAWTPMGQAKVPLLLCMSLYYTLSYERSVMLQGAILAGLLQDALGMTPLGYSSFAFVIAGIIVARFKDLIFVQQTLTLVLLGTVSAAGVTLLLFALLARGGMAEVPVLWMVLKTVGTMILGAVTAPLTFRLLTHLDQKLGNIEKRYA